MNTVLIKILFSELTNDFKIKIDKKERCPYVNLVNFSFKSMDERYFNDIENSLKKIGSIEYRIVNNYKEFIVLLDEFFDLNREWWLNKGYPGLIKIAGERQFFLNSLPALYKEGNIFFSIIKKNNEIISASLNFTDEFTIYNYSSGHKLNYKKYGIGKIHLYFLFKNAIDNGFKCVDFMRGEESYKYKWLASDKYNYDIIIKK